MTCFSFTLHHHCGLAGGLILCYYYSGTLIDNLPCLEQHWEPLHKERGEVSKRELALKHPPGQNIHRLCSNFVGPETVPNFKGCLDGGQGTHGEQLQSWPQFSWSDSFSPLFIKIYKTWYLQDIWLSIEGA